jgi:hypothetical protein
MDEQGGVVARRQVLRLGLDDDFVESQVRRRTWSRLHRGVYVDHTGPPTWAQRAWAALLFYDRAALCDESALTAFGHTPATGSGPLHVAVDQSRRVSSLPGVRLHRITDLAGHLHPTRRPECVRFEVAVLQVASRLRGTAASIAALADACQSRRTTAARLSDQLTELRNLPGRSDLLTVLQDVASGAHSVLEHRYLTRVERPHRLPTARRQRRVRPGRRPAYRDVEYLGGKVVVELDGRLGHDATLDRWADLERDVESAVLGGQTLRFGWGQVLDPCRVAAAVGVLLGQAGWRGRPKPCGPSCSVGDLRRVPGTYGRKVS